MKQYGGKRDPTKRGGQAEIPSFRLAEGYFLMKTSNT